MNKIWLSLIEKIFARDVSSWAEDVPIDIFMIR